MSSIAYKPVQCKNAKQAKGTLFFGYRILVRYPSIPPFPEFHNQVTFSESIPSAWYSLVGNQDILKADLFKRGRIVAQFNRAWPELYQEGKS